ncbi:hypothetical protein EES44_01180 [Streptomyces sp. ADI96-15]|nr:hypothetical protein EES44_01180 [Streptomyces sp. ADI96-15]
MRAPGESRLPGCPSAVRRSCSWSQTSKARSRMAASRVCSVPSGPRSVAEGSRVSFRSWRERRMIVYSSSAVISGPVWWRRTSTCISMYRWMSVRTWYRSRGSVWIGRGSPSISQSRPMTWETTSRTDQAGQGVARFHCASGRGWTSSNIASTEWVQASA